MRSEVQPPTARAVAMLTIWVNSPNDTEGVHQELLATMDEGPEAMIELVQGLLNLAGTLLVKLGGAENREREILQEIGLRNATPD